jgi:hypothetical protein
MVRNHLHEAIYRKIYFARYVSDHGVSDINVGPRLKRVWGSREIRRILIVL